MPTYEYECLSCRRRFELFQKMSDKPVKKCPKCGKSVRRLIGTGSGIIFKGAGFYATDYRKSKLSQNNEVKDKQKACPKNNDPQGSPCSGCPQSK